MLNEALRWWAARMRELLPERLMQRAAGRSDAIVVVAGTAPDSPATLLLRRAGQETTLGVFIPGTTTREALRAMLNGQAGRHPVLLRPPHGALLEKPLSLPLAAEPELHRVLGYEMGRLTPFQPAELFWSWEVIRRDRAHGRLHLRLALVPAAPLQPLVAALEAAGMRPAMLEAAAPAGPPRQIPLHPETAHIAWQRRATRGLVIACGSLAIAVIGLPFLTQSLALARLDARIAAAQPQVTEVQALRQRLAAASAGLDAIAAASSRTGDALAVLAAVTDLLPDDTVLDDLQLRERRLTITGQSAAAPRLIGGLAADPTFRNPGFVAPVTRDTTAGRDVFSIRAEVGP